MRGSRTRQIVGALLTVTAGLALTACGESEGDPQAASGTKPQETLTVAIPGATSGTQLWVAQEIGAFEGAGVDVTVTTATPSTLINTVVSGEADLGVFPYPNLAKASASGKPLSVVYALYTGGIASVLAGGPGIKSTEDLAGADRCRIATSVVGTQPYWAASYYAEKYNPDCELLQVDTATIAATVQRGDAVAGVASYGSVAGIVKTGGHLLVDTRDPEVRAEVFGKDSVQPDIVLFGARDALGDKSAALEAFMKGMDEAYSYIEQHSDKEIVETIRKVRDLASLDDSAVQAVVEGTTPYLPDLHGYISPERWNLALQYYGQWDVPDFSADMPAAQYENAVDMSFYDRAVGAPPNAGSQAE